MYIPKRKTDNEYSDVRISVEDRTQAGLGADCFYCHRPLMNNQNDYRGHDKFAIQWDDLTLHPNCAELLAIHLIKDVRSGELRFEKAGK